jgi:hypothetical protein
MNSLDKLLEEIKGAPLATPCKKEGVVYIWSARTIKANKDEKDTFGYTLCYSHLYDN